MTIYPIRFFEESTFLLNFLRFMFYFLNFLILLLFPQFLFRPYLRTKKIKELEVRKKVIELKT